MVFAQFPINQFRCIGWFNAVMGMTIILIHMLMFKGEMKCNRHNKHRTCSTCKIVKISFTEKHFPSKVLSIAVSSTISEIAYFFLGPLKMCVKSKTVSENSKMLLLPPNVFHKNTISVAMVLY